MTDAPLQDILWLLLCAGLVFLMQAGFTCLESGSTRAKNSINVAVKNMADFVIAVLVFWAIGFGLMFGSSYGGWFGTDQFLFPTGENASRDVFFLFQAMFCTTAATIMSGAAAERTRFIGYVVVAVLTAGLLYPLFGHWAWNPGSPGNVLLGEEAGAPAGFLLQMGFVDFAGSTVVHSVGGWLALAAIIVVGPRQGRFAPDGTLVPIHGHNQPLAVLGVLLLYLGWFGFNGGSTLALNDQVPAIIVHTVIAGAAGSLAAGAYSVLRVGKPELAPILNGAIAGLVAITANAHAVSAADSVLIGAVGGLVMIACSNLLLRLKLDDVIGAVPTHLAPGIWGTMAVAFFGDAEKLGTGLSMVEQISVQATGVVLCALWTFPMAYLVIWAVNKISPLRVDPDDEDRGLNISEHGATTDMVDLFQDLEAQSRSGDPTFRLRVEPFTEVGQIAARFNRVLDSLQKAVAKSDAVIRSARDAIVTFAGDTLAITSANPAARQLFGLDSTLPVTMNLTDLFLHGERLVGLGSGRPDSFSRLVARRTDGGLFPAEVSFSSVNLGGEPFAVALLRDVTDREATQRALKESEERYAQALRAINDGVYEWEMGSGLVTLSARLMQIINATTEDVTSDTWMSRIHPDDLPAYGAALRAHLKGLTLRFVCEYRFQPHGGNYVWLRQYGICSRDAWGRAYRMVGSCGDITQRKSLEDGLREARENAEDALRDLREAQETLVQSEKMASLGGLVAGVAHEINTPVGIVLTAATHLSERTDSLLALLGEGKLKRSDFQTYLDLSREATTMIYSNITRAADLIHSFKQVAVDQTSDSRRTFELGPYLEELLLSLGPSLRHTAVEIETDCPRGILIDGYPGSLSQLVTNLIMNALTHAFITTSEEAVKAGLIQISASFEAKPTALELAERRDGDVLSGMVTLQIRDNGIGIPAEHLRQVFDPFFTTKRGQGGSGLGLNIVYNIATVT
ncbi:MAG: ammonium transporter, partial [Rhodospirillaceae bacterium]